MSCGPVATFAIRKYGPSRLMGGYFSFLLINRMMFLWSILSFSMTAVVNRDGLISTRFFQGAVQSGYVY